MINPRIDVEKVLSEIKENLEIIKTIDKDNLTKEEVAIFKKELSEAKELALAIKQNRS